MASFSNYNNSRSIQGQEYQNDSKQMNYKIVKKQNEYSSLGSQVESSNSNKDK